MTVGGNTGGGVVVTPGPDAIGYPPFARGRNLTAMAERLRADNWPVGEPVVAEVFLAVTPPEDEDEGADH